MMNGAGDKNPQANERKSGFDKVNFNKFDKAGCQKSKVNSL